MKPCQPIVVVLRATLQTKYICVVHACYHSNHMKPCQPNVVAKREALQTKYIFVVHAGNHSIHVQKLGNCIHQIQLLCGNCTKKIQLLDNCRNQIQLLGNCKNQIQLLGNCANQIQLLGITTNKMLQDLLGKFRQLISSGGQDEFTSCQKIDDGDRWQDG